jgi:hypothetical protein
METLENNKLIAEFMGLVVSNREDYHSSLHTNVDSDLKYHSSWDWLMPVVEKIETLGFKFEKNYQRVDEDWQCLIVKGHDILFQEFDRKGLKAANYVVVEFIKWYNQKQ